MKFLLSAMVNNGYFCDPDLDMDVSGMGILLRFGVMVFGVECQYSPVM